jgi:hypothetical protein
MTSYYKRPQNYIIYFRNIVASSTTTPPLITAQSESLRSSLLRCLRCSITVRTSVGAMKNERRSASVPLLLSVRTNVLPLVEVPWKPPKLSLWLRPPKLVWRLQIESTHWHYPGSFHKIFKFLEALKLKDLIVNHSIRSCWKYSVEI